ncbi:putative HD superfamily hydrolase involved in NAD metabolism [Clostridiales Family XIII bacterium PM5-7]
MNTSYINEYIEKNYSEERKTHTEGVRITAINLAKRYGADEKKAEIAALFHDMFRGQPQDVLNYYVRELDLDPKYLNNSNLAHSKIARIIMERDYSITDGDVLNAVSFHTTGRPGMSTLEKVIYIADAIEPNRNYPGVEQLRELAEVDLDEACRLSLNNTIAYVQKQGNYLDQDTLLARDDIEQRLEKMNG